MEVGNIRDNKNKFFLALLAVFSLVLIYVLYDFFAGKDERKPLLELSGVEIAQRTAQFLDMSSKPNGMFVIRYQCDPESREEKKCREAPIEEPPHTGQIILAYYELTKRTGDNTYKEKADKALEVSIKLCHELDKNYCEWNFFPLYRYYKDTGDKKYLDAMLAVSGRFLDDKVPLKDAVGGNYGNKLAMLYEVTSERKYIDRLRHVADEVLNRGIESTDQKKPLYEDNGFIVKVGSFQAVWSVYLPAYSATKDEKYLIAAKDFYDKANLKVHLRELRRRLDIQNFAKIIDSLLILAEMENNQNSRYRDDALALMRSVVLHLWDSEEEVKFDGDYGFLSNFKKGENTKATLMSGWVAQELLKFDEEKFRVQLKKSEEAFTGS